MEEDYVYGYLFKGNGRGFILDTGPKEYSFSSVEVWDGSEYVAVAKVDLKFPEMAGMKARIRPEMGR